MAATAGKLKYVAPDDESERTRILACNRILLYARGLDLDARAGLDLATESLKRAGEAGDLETILGQMHCILHERDIDPFLSDGKGGRLASAPPMRRASMVSDGERCRSFLGWVWSGVLGAIGLAYPGKTAWKRREA